MAIYMKNKRGVHFVPVEHGLCGDAWDIGSEDKIGDEEGGNMEPVEKQPITCTDCRAHIEMILSEFGKPKRALRKDRS